MHLTLAIVAKTLFDAELSGDAETVGHSLEVVMNYFMSPMRWFRFLDYLPLPSSRRYWRAIGRLDDDHLQDHPAHRDRGPGPGDLLSRLLAARRRGRRRDDRSPAPRRGRDPGPRRPRDDRTGLVL